MRSSPFSGSKFRLALLALMLVLAGCASTPQASAQRDADAKRFGSPPATAAVYIYRIDNSHEGSVLWIDGRLIGATLPGTYFRVHLEPGRHLLTGYVADNGRMALETRPGEVYFVALNVVTGQSQFQLVADEIGRKVVTNCCSLMENWAPGQRPLLR